MLSVSQHEEEKADVILLQSTCPAGAGGARYGYELGSDSAGMARLVDS